MEKEAGMTDLQFATFLRMIHQVLDGCRDLDEAKQKIDELLAKEPAQKSPAAIPAQTGRDRPEGATPSRALPVESITQNRQECNKKCLQWLHPLQAPGKARALPRHPVTTLR